MPVPEPTAPSFEHADDWEEDGEHQDEWKFYELDEPELDDDEDLEL